MFNYYLQCVLEFSQQFDPTETLVLIAKDEAKRQAIIDLPETNVTLSFVLENLWIKLGLLPLDDENPGIALIAEFFLYELIIKYSDNLESLNLKHLQELFSYPSEDEEEQEE